MLKPLRSFGSPVADTIRRMSYLQAQSDYPEEPSGIPNQTRSGYVPHLSDDVIDILIGHTEKAPPLYEVMLAHLHGAVSRIPPSETPYPLRQPGFDGWVLAAWQQPAQGEVALDWVSRSWAALAPYTRGAYVNGLEEEGEERVKAAYGVNYERLSVIKRKYDPDNFFSLNQNIKPAA